MSKERLRGSISHKMFEVMESLRKDLGLGCFQAIQTMEGELGSQRGGYAVIDNHSGLSELVSMIDNYKSEFGN